jgi:hypothetical protein
MEYYKLEDRGFYYIYHWFIYMLGGMRHIDISNGPVYIKIPAIETNHTHHTSITSEIIPVKFKYLHESLDIIKDMYKYTNTTTGNCIKIMPGEEVLISETVDGKTYIFLRDLFLSRLPRPVFDEKRYIYITRKNSHILNPAHQSKATRQILNEDEFLPDLRAIGFLILQFEDYTVKEKIDIFQKSKLIISPNSGGLVFSLFANKDTKIVEITPANTIQLEQYKQICSILDISYQQFTDITVVDGPPKLGNTGWNIIVNKDAFLEFVRTQVS